jgi:hypothetical protein
MIGLPGGRFRLFTSAPLELRDTRPDPALLQQLVDERGPRRGAVDASLLDTYELGRAHVARSVVGRSDCQTRAWLTTRHAQIVDFVVTRKELPALEQRLAELLPRRAPACV